MEYAELPPTDKLLQAQFDVQIKTDSGPSGRVVKAWVCGRSPADIVGSNPTGGMDICLF
jgi:hypothetical protein